MTRADEIQFDLCHNSTGVIWLEAQHSRLGDTLDERLAAHELLRLLVAEEPDALAQAVLADEPTARRVADLLDQVAIEEPKVAGGGHAYAQIIRAIFAHEAAKDVFATLARRPRP